MVDIAVQEQRGAADHVQVVDGIQTVVDLFKAFLPAQAINRINILDLS